VIVPSDTGRLPADRDMLLRKAFVDLRQVPPTWGGLVELVCSDAILECHCAYSGGWERAVVKSVRRAAAEMSRGRGRAEHSIVAELLIWKVPDIPLTGVGLSGRAGRSGITHLDAGQQANWASRLPSLPDENHR
jgi:hypothetical protein